MRVCKVSGSYHVDEKDSDYGDVFTASGQLNDPVLLVAAACPQVSGPTQPRVMHRATGRQHSEPLGTQDGASVQLLCVNGDHWVAVSCVEGQPVTVSASRI